MTRKPPAHIGLYLVKRDKARACCPVPKMQNRPNAKRLITPVSTDIPSKMFRKKRDREIDLLRTVMCVTNVNQATKIR